MNEKPITSGPVTPYDVARPVQYHLRDVQPAMAEAWRRAFAGVEGVAVSNGHIFDATADAIVSPANSFGAMNGGIDRIYLGRFGDQLYVRLQQRLAEDFAGELPVGQATLVETGEEAIPYLVSAPTMREPGDVSGTLNAYLAFGAALRVIREHNRRAAAGGVRPIATVLCPGLCTNTGNMPVEECARQMRQAYDETYGGRPGEASVVG